MDPFMNKVSARWQEDGVGTNAGVSVTKAAVESKMHTVTHISGSGDAAALVTIESPASTILYRKRFAAAFTFSETLPVGCFVSGENAAILVKISASTSNCEANIAGYTYG